MFEPDASSIESGVSGYAAPLGYLGLIITGSAVTSRTMSDAARLRLPLVLVATHMAWGAGFLVGLRKRPPHL